MNREIVNKAKYWCAKRLIAYGFPSPPITKHRLPQEYCKNYPYLYIHDNSLESIEFQESLDEINLEATKLFSLFNLDFINAAIADWLLLISCLLPIFFYLLTYALFIFGFDYKWILVQWVLLFSICFGIIFNFLCKSCFSDLRRKHIKIFYRLEAFYISVDLSSNNNLNNDKLQESLKKRVKNLSRLIYTRGQQDKYITEGLKQHYYRISLDIYNKIDWIDSEQDSKLPDLRRYFNHLTDCLVTNQIGKIQVDRSLFKLQKPQHDLNELMNKTEKTMAFSEKIFAWIPKLISVFSIFK